jgi:hypothetical protein
MLHQDAGQPASRTVSRRVVLTAGAGLAVGAAAMVAGASDALADSPASGLPSAADELAIRRLSVYYGLGTDAIGRGDKATGLAYYEKIFTSDALITAGFDAANPQLSSTGPVAWADVVAGAFIPFKATQHLLATINVELAQRHDEDDRSHATMTSYLQATHIYRDTKEMLIVLGIYHDDVVRRPEGWRISARFLEYLSFEKRVRFAP